MELSDDQKKIAKWVSVAVIVTAIALGVFFILGSSIPKK